MRTVVILTLAAILASTIGCSSSRKRQPLAEQGDLPGVALLDVEPRSDLPGVPHNRIVLVVGDIGITDLDLKRMTDIISKRPRNQRSAQPPAEEAVQYFIERSIVEMAASEESIIVSDQRVSNEVQRRRESAGIADDLTFRRTVERETGMSYDNWLEDLRYQIMRRLIIQIRLSIPQPDEREVEAFYRQHRNQVGQEFSYREIVFRPRDNSIAEERRISQIANEVHREVSGNPRRFAEVARSHSDNVSPLRFNGGFQDHIPIHEVAERDERVAGVLFNMTPGQVSPVFRSGNRYVIVRLEGRRPVPLDKLREMIMMRLYIEKEEEVFDAWIERRRREVAIIRRG